jgi:hypothetical protein
MGEAGPQGDSRLQGGWKAQRRVLTGIYRINRIRRRDKGGKRNSSIGRSEEYKQGYKRLWPSPSC